MNLRVALLAALALGAGSATAWLLASLLRGDLDAPPPDPTADPPALSGALQVLEREAGRLARPGPLAKAHSELEGLLACTQCHGSGSRVSDSRCVACHEEISTRAQRSVAFHGLLEGDCATCHLDHLGRDVSLIVFDESSFQHDQTRFPLRGKHVESECRTCHDVLDAESDSSEFHYQGVPFQTCTACHRDPHAGGERTDGHVHAILRIDLDAPAAQLPEPDERHPLAGRDCTECHTEASFRLAGIRDESFEHELDTGFALEGVHAGVDCGACHTAERREQEIAHARAPGSGAPESCGSCHDDPHAAALGDEKACASCHTSTHWSEGFDHDLHTDFHLDPLHVRLACETCHDDLRYLSTGNECGACHRDASELLAGRFESHEGDSDPHDRVVSCADCHGETVESNRFSALAAKCADCHVDPYAELLSTWRARLYSIATDGDPGNEGAERLRRSGVHNFLFAERLLRQLSVAEISP